MFAFYPCDCSIFHTNHCDGYNHVYFADNVSNRLLHVLFIIYDVSYIAIFSIVCITMDGTNGKYFAWGYNTESVEENAVDMAL